MLKFSRRWLGVVSSAFFGGMILSVAVARGGDPITGRDYTGACASCHGSKGISANPMVPSLAGQDRSYLIGQLRAFREGRRRHAAMEGIVVKLTDGDITYMAAYYAKQAPMVGQKKITLKKRGEEERFYEDCKGCHGDRAEGREGIPRLAGQQAVYLERTLLAYRIGERSAPGMNEAVISLTTEQVKALSRFLSSLK